MNSCNIKILIILKFFTRDLVRFSYSINRRLKSKEKKIEKYGLPRKKREINNRTKVIDEINLCLNSWTFNNENMLNKSLIISTILSNSLSVIEYTIL